MTFGSKLTVAAFKAKHNVTTLQVVKNPTNDKLFVSGDGKTLGAVSKNYDPKLDKEFVELILEDTGSTVWCLHNPSAVNVLETL